MAEADPKQTLPTDRQVPHSSRDNWYSNQKQHLSTDRQILWLHRGSCCNRRSRRLNLSTGRQFQQLNRDSWYHNFRQMYKHRDLRRIQTGRLSPPDGGRQQRQQIQPRRGRLVEQAPQPRQQLPHPQRRMQRPDQWNFGESGEQSMPRPPSYRQQGGSSKGGRQGMRGRATGGRDARIGTGAGWATNPETLGKDSYNPALPPRAWGYIYKSGRCFWCFQKWTPGHVCNRDVPREIPSL